MKTFFLPLILLLASALFGKAQILSSLTLTNGVNLINANPLLAYAIQLTNPNTTNTVTVKLYDNDSATSTNTVKAGYVTYTWTRTSVDTIITNVFGNLQTNTEVKLLRTTNTTAAITNEAVQVWPTISIAASSSVTVDFQDSDTLIAVGKGLNALVTPNTISGFLTYLPLP